MHAPQILVIILYALNFGLIWAMHGKPTKYHAGYTALGTVILFALLIWGGFFR